MQPLFHAYIVSGPRDTARLHISELLSPYGAFGSGNPDYLFSEFVSFAVDDARNLRSWQELSAVGERKVCVICTDFITPEAQNALLKTFEEPVSNTHLFFVVPKADILLPTFLSRVRHVKVQQGAFDATQADAFLGMKAGERIALIQKITAKSDEDDASAEVRERAISLIESLEQLYSKKMREGEDCEYVKQIEDLLRFKKYLYMPGASVKAILETIALTQ